MQEFYQIAFRTKLYRSLKALQADLNEWVMKYNIERTHEARCVAVEHPSPLCLKKKVTALNLT